MNIELSDNKATPMTVAKLIEILSTIENKKAIVTRCMYDTFVPVPQEDICLTFGKLEEGNTNELKVSPPAVLCLNATQIPVVSSDEDYSITEQIAWITDVLESLGIVVSDQMPETEKHVVTDLDGLALFNFHKSKALHHISMAIRETIIMGDVVIADEELNYKCPGCEHCKPTNTNPDIMPVETNEDGSCKKWCGMNYCDENGCTKRRRQPISVRDEVPTSPEAA